MKKAKTVKEVLIAGRWILNRLELCKKMLFDDPKNPTKCCAVGAVWLVRCNYYNHERAVDVLNSVAPGRRVSRYNDRSHTTKRDILHLFDAAIARCK